MLGKATKARRKQNKTLRQLRHLTHICKRGNQKLLLVQTKRYFGEQSKAIVNLVNGMERREKLRRSPEDHPRASAPTGPERTSCGPAQA